MSTALFEHAYYIGNYMSGILYGVDMVMYFMTLRQLVHRRRQKKSWRFFFWYSTALFVTLTIDISINAVWGENMWITNRDKPGGVPVFIATQLSDWYQAWGSSAAVLLVFMSDALLIYRLFVIYNSSFLVIIVPCLTYIVGLVFAILELVASFKPGGFFFGKKSVNFGIPYYALTISLNIIVTSLICLRLFSLSRVVRQTMGEAHARTYTSVAAIMVESAAPYSLFGIAFLIPYARGSLVSITLGQVWAKITCLAPSLIILRVVTDKAWTKETFAQTGTAGAGFSSFNVRQQTTTVPDTMNSLNSDTIAGSYAAESKKGNSAASLPMSVAKASV